MRYSLLIAAFDIRKRSFRVKLSCARSIKKMSFPYMEQVRKHLIHEGYKSCTLKGHYTQRRTDLFIATKLSFYFLLPPRALRRNVKNINCFMIEQRCDTALLNSNVRTDVETHRLSVLFVALSFILSLPSCCSNMGVMSRDERFHFE